ncbi:MBL fold metallo-hydrolase [Treponema sp. HNW]|uniref:ComEC/Rec2 family competence protein n=1 Tax=Treponema sp. HNW TaxID=3116654 RepID=UPI003D0CAA2A
MRFTCINVGYGDSFLLECEDSVILVDGGSALDSEFTDSSCRIRSADYLIKAGIKHIDTLIITHIHEDHAAGLAAVCNRIPVKKVLIPYAPKLFKNRIIPPAHENAPENVTLFAQALYRFTDIMQLCESRGIPVEEISAGMNIPAGNLQIRVLGPAEKDKNAFIEGLRNFFSAPPEEQQSKWFPYLDRISNAASLLLKISNKDIHLLLCADNCPANWDRSIFPLLKNVTVLKLPHHGQKDAVDEKIMAMMNPDYILTTASSDRRHNSADPAVYKMLTELYAPNKQPVFLFSDGINYEPYFSREKPFQAIRISFGENGSSPEFVDV